MIIEEETEEVGMEPGTWQEVTIKSRAAIRKNLNKAFLGYDRQASKALSAFRIRRSLKNLRARSQK
jgi:hypothetical protein